MNQLPETVDQQDMNVALLRLGVENYAANLALLNALKVITKGNESVASLIADCEAEVSGSEKTVEKAISIAKKMVQNG